MCGRVLALVGVALTVLPALIARAATPGDQRADMELIEALKHEDAKWLPISLTRDREQFVRRATTVIDEYRASTDTTKAFVRRKAVIALGTYGGADAVKPLRKLVADADEPYRRDAIAALGRTRAAAGVELVVPFLTHADELFREAAIDGLAAAGTQPALDALKAFDPAGQKEFIRRKHRDAVAKLTAGLNKSAGPDKK